MTEYLRPVDLAREHGVSTQSIRNYEDEGLLPASERTDSGYRRYTRLHAQALRTFLALRAGHGHRTAVALMHAANSGDLAELFRLVDRAHADAQRERAVHEEVAQTLTELSTLPRPDTGRGHALTVGELAHRLRVHPATLRKWEAAGILCPRRDPATGYRLYTRDDERDAHIALRLRRGGARLEQVARFVAEVRHTGGTEKLAAFLADWRERIAHRSRAALRGAAHLDRYLDLLEAAEDIPDTGNGNG